jgi:hypothetical protein
VRRQQGFMQRWLATSTQNERARMLRQEDE